MAKTNPRTTTAGPPPKEAVDYLRRKGVRTGYDYQEVWREEHTHAFTIANMMRLDLLSDVQESIAKAQQEGATAEQWKRGMAAKLAARGWWGRLPPPDPNDPQAVERANLYLSRRLDTIWRVNTRQAAQAGAWERGQRSTSHPYLLYRVGPSRVHREQHLAWDGVLLPKDAKFWTVANPMNGWGCKCYTRFVSRAQYRRYADRGIPQLTPGDGKRGSKKVITEEPVLHPVPYRNEATGQSHTGYSGIDHGFERNPGVGRMEQLSEAFWRKDQAAQPKLEPIGPAVSLLLPKDGDRAFRRPAQHALDAIARVHGTGDDSLRAAEVERLPDDDKSNGRLTLRDHQSTDLIELKPTGDTPYLTTAHEVGHLIQHRALPAGPVSQQPPSSLEIAELFAAIKKSERRRALKAEIDRLRQTLAEAKTEGKGEDELKPIRKRKRTLSYAVERQEAFARAYAQWIAVRSGSAAMRGELDLILSGRAGSPLRYWGHDDFLPVAAALDRLFMSWGWTVTTPGAP